MLQAGLNALIWNILGVYYLFLCMEQATFEKLKHYYRVRIRLYVFCDLVFSTLQIGIVAILYRDAESVRNDTKTIVLLIMNGFRFLKDLYFFRKVIVMINVFLEMWNSIGTKNFIVMKISTFLMAFSYLLVIIYLDLI